MVLYGQIQSIVSCCSTSNIKEYNMKKFLLLAGVACLFATSAEATQFSPYVSGKLSYDFNRVKVRFANEATKGQGKIKKDLIGTHFAAGVSAGYLRGELELNNSNSIKSHHGPAHVNLKKYSVMANVYYDYLTCTPWTPYVGAGLGYSWLKGVWHANGEKIQDKSVCNLAWQIMAGVTYDLNTNWKLDAGYRYADLGRIRKNEGSYVTKTAVRDHEIMLGVRYTF